MLACSVLGFGVRSLVAREVCCRDVDADLPPLKVGWHILHQQGEPHQVVVKNFNAKAPQVIICRLDSNRGLHGVLVRMGRNDLVDATDGVLRIGFHMQVVVPRLHHHDYDCVQFSTIILLK